MIDNNKKLQYIKDIDPKPISAKEVLRELRRKKNLEKSNENLDQATKFKNIKEPYQKVKPLKNNSLLSPFLGRHVRYLVIVLALFFISIVSFTYTLVDTSNFDNRNLAQVVDSPSLEFNSHSDANIYLTICNLSKNEKCDLSFNTKNVLSIKAVDFPNYLKAEFNHDTQSGKIVIDYENTSSIKFDTPTVLSIDLISSVDDLNKIVNQQVIFTNGIYKEVNRTYRYFINYFSGECTNFPLDNTTELTFENKDECLKYKQGMSDNIFLVNSSSYLVNLNNVCSIDNSKKYKFEIPVEWNDSSNEISYVSVKNSDINAYIVPSYIEFRDKAINSILVNKIKPSEFVKSVTLGFEIDRNAVFSNEFVVPIIIYYPNTKSIQKEFNLHINFKLLSENQSDASIDYKLSTDSTNLHLDLKYNLNCRIILAKVELWDKYCSEYLDTIVSEKLFPTNVINKYDFPLNTLQKGDYCVKIFIRNSSEFNWKLIEIRNLSINSNKNSAPIILSKPIMTDLSGNQQLNYSVVYSDLENENVEVQFIKKPSWVLSSGNTITGIPNSKGSDLISFQLKDSSGNLSNVQQFYVNSVLNESNIVFDESELFAQSSEVQVSGNIKVKWSVSAYTNILKQEVYFARVGNPYTILATYNDSTTSSMIFDTRNYSDGKYIFKIKAYLDDGEAVEQVSSVYIFTNTAVSSTTTATQVSTQVSSSTSITTTSKVNTSSITSSISSSVPVSTAVSSEVSGNVSVSNSIISATILDQLPINGAVIELSNLTISGKMSFPEGKKYLENSLKVFLNGEDISSICIVLENIYQCNKNELINILKNRTGLNDLEIAYSDTDQSIYNQNVNFEIINSEIINSSTSSSFVSKVSAVDEEKVLVLYGRKVPNFVLFGFVSIILILLLVFAIPWLLFFISERKMNNKVKKLASI